MGSSQIRDCTHVFCIGSMILYHWATREALFTLFNFNCSSVQMAIHNTQCTTFNTEYSLYNVQYRRLKIPHLIHKTQHITFNTGYWSPKVSPGLQVRAITQLSAWYLLDPQTQHIQNQTLIPHKASFSIHLFNFCWWSAASEPLELPSHSLLKYLFLGASSISLGQASTPARICHRIPHLVPSLPTII